MCQTPTMAFQSADARPTSFDVAERAGLSRSTVSQVLSGKSNRFSTQTRDRVRTAAEELGYRPSRAGRALVTGVSDIIVVAVPNVTFGRHLQDAVDRIARATASQGMSVVVRYAGDDETVTLLAVLDLRPAIVVDLGVFLSDKSRSAIESGGTRIVPNPDFSIVENPNHLIGRIQARHLLRVPERRLVVAHIADDRPDLFGGDRGQGVIDEAFDAGHQRPLVMAVPFDRAAARSALAEIVAEDSGPLGICCYNDDVAIAVLAACRDLNLSVPDRVAVVGVDRTDIGLLVDPPLTSVAFDLPGMLTSVLGGLDVSQSVPSTDDINFNDFVKLEVGGSS